jgi:ribose/xylose/arabinose/galactoside ABC-type transport system permease subunit
VAQPVEIWNPVDVARVQTPVPSQDAGPAWTPKFGVNGACVTSANMSAAPVAVTDAPPAGQKLVVDDINLSGDTALAYTLTEETTGTVIWKEYLPANGGAQRTMRGKIKLATAVKRLMCQTSGAGNVAVLKHVELGMLPSLLVGALVAGVVGAVVGVAIVRLTGPAAAVVTLGLLVIVNQVLNHAKAFTRGTQTFTSVPRTTTFFSGYWRAISRSCTPIIRLS